MGSDPRPWWIEADSWWSARLMRWLSCSTLSTTCLTRRASYPRCWWWSAWRKPVRVHTLYTPNGDRVETDGD